MKQHIFLHERYLGARDIPTYRRGLDDKKLSISNSYLFICGKCGHTWGRLMHDHFAAFVQPVSRNCLEHARFPSDGHLANPCDIDGDANNLSEAWPLPVLHHELAVLCHHEIEQTLYKAKEL